MGRNKSLIVYFFFIWSLCIADHETHFNNIHLCKLVVKNILNGVNDLKKKAFFKTRYIMIVKLCVEYVYMYSGFLWMPGV